MAKINLTALRAMTLTCALSAALALSACSTEKIVDNTIDGTLAVTNTAVRGTYGVAKMAVKGTGAAVRAVTPGGK